MDVIVSLTQLATYSLSLLIDVRTACLVISFNVTVQNFNFRRWKLCNIVQAAVVILVYKKWYNKMSIVRSVLARHIVRKVRPCVSSCVMQLGTARCKAIWVWHERKCLLCWTFFSDQRRDHRSCRCVNFIASFENLLKNLRARYQKQRKAFSSYAEGKMKRSLRDSTP